MVEAKTVIGIVLLTIGACGMLVTAFFECKKWIINRIRKEIKEGNK